MIVCDVAGHPGTEQVLVQGNAVKVVVRMLQGETCVTHLAVSYFLIVVDM